MSSQVFPTLQGLGWDIVRTPMWRNTRQSSYAGVDTSIAYWSFPKWKWELTFNVLREGSFGVGSYTELTQLMGLYNQMRGGFDSFLYTDQDDNTVTDQAIGAGDGTTTAFQLVRQYAGLVEPMFAPNVVTNVKVNGVTKTAGVDYTIGAWGSANPGKVLFTVAPANGLSITVTYSYYFPCRFDDDSMDFTKFMQALFSAKGVTFTSIKLGA